jgi:hypothetical protein
MVKCGKDILLKREGTEQQQRFIDALNPDSVKLNDFGVKEWMRFAYNFASQVNYFSSDNHETPSDDWREFFKAEEELETFLKDVEDGEKITPHLALFVVFVKLIELSKKRFNKLTQRHLDFYYQQVLSIQKEPATPDKVHVIFELAKNAVSEKIAEGTELDGGKDADGNKLIYKSSDELIASQAKVAKLKSVYSDHINTKLKAAEIANSFDGKGTDFPDDEIKWWPFAYYEKPSLSDQADIREYDELSDANIGFAVSGEILELQEGERNVQLTLILDKELTRAYSDTYIDKSIKIYCTGEKGWLGPFSLMDETKTAANNSGVFASNLKLCKLLFTIPKEEEAVVKYDSKVHFGNYNSNYPVCKIVFDTKETEACILYNDLQGKQISELKIDVNVKDILGLNLHNDQGAINNKKPFYPFGTQPVKKSKFYIEYEELYKKKWTDLTVDIEWKNTPDNFKNWYFAYRDLDDSNISSFSFISAIYKVIDLDVSASNNQANYAPANSAGVSASEYTALPLNYKLEINNQADNFYVKADNHFKVTVEKQEKEEWTSINALKNVTLFTKDNSGIFNLHLPVTNPSDEKADVGPIRLSLNQTFLHAMYPRLYALAMTSEDKEVTIPNEPYTPFVEEIKLSYNASASIKIEDKKYTLEDFSLYHEYPFGQAEESITLKQNNGILKTTEAKKLFVVPEYKHGGELYIGLENAKTRQIISLLIQVLEGSEKPEMNAVEAEDVEWCVLCNNDWKALNSSDILSNNIDNFLKSGIFKFTVPKEATSDNTLLPAGYIWLRAKISKDYNLVSKAIGIHAQAVETEFSDNNNNLTHLTNGLPGKTISKMVNRIAKVKGVSQPYNSFGGVPAETSNAYYRRISERLRHKKRAITIWDYEHLVLQQFPEIYKIKCLNHTNSEPEDGKPNPSFLAPGHITLVVIPDIVNKNVFDIYKPGVSAATLNKIQKYLSELSSPLIQLHVDNPVYEEVQIKLKVKFKEGYDVNYYKSILEKDITKLLSPWAFNPEAGIRFGLTFHKSVLIKYVEDLGYVDFVSDVKLYQTTENTIGMNGDEVNVASPSNPMAVLVSSRSHNVEIDDGSCPI